MLLTRPVKHSLEEIEDKEAVRELIEFERFSRDNSLWEEMTKCYTKDSKVAISWFEGTGQEFVESSKKMTVRAPHKIHSTCTWLNGNRAVSIMVVTIQKRTSLQGILTEMMSEAKLMFRTIKIEGEWYIEAMEGIYEQDSLVPVYPQNSCQISIEELSGFRESYCCLSYVLSKEGYEINNDLPGIDRPDLVEKLYIEANEWLLNT